MSVDAVSFESFGSDKVGGPSLAARRTAGGTPDFAALLSIAQLWNDEADDTATAEPQARIEASRSVSVIGHLRTTVIRFTDGSSSIETSVVGDDPAPNPLAVLHGAAHTAAPRIVALNDLEPDAGIDRRSDAEEAQARWSGWKAPRPAALKGSPAMAGMSSHGPHISEQARALEAMRVGRLVDILI
jgi:hypothetical protein